MSLESTTHIYKSYGKPKTKSSMLKNKIYDNHFLLFWREYHNHWVTEDTVLEIECKHSQLTSVHIKEGRVEFPITDNLSIIIDKFILPIFR